MDTSLRRRLEDALGAGVVIADGAVLRPADVEGVAGALRIVAEGGHRVRICSGDPQPEQAPAAGSVLSLCRLAGIAVDASAGVARVEAGAALEALRSALAAAQMDVAGLPGPGRSRHVGTAVARGELPRRSLCGVEAVLPGGDLIRAGGAVLKDVVGYDLTAILLGSAGRLAAITAVQLRLTPAQAGPVRWPPAGEHLSSDLAGVFDPRGILVGP